jgi:hypothetical protein
MARRRKNKRKKIEPKPEPPTSEPGPGVIDWQSQWQENRTITTDRSVSKEWQDPKDPTGRTCIPAVGNAVWIIGNGIAKGNGDSPRLTVLGDYAGVESTVYIKGSKGNCELRPKTDHYCVECGPDGCFGGYTINANFDDNAINTKKEQTHAIGYSPRLWEKKVALPKGRLFGLRGKCYNIENNTKVKIEAWIDIDATGNWKRVYEGIDDGNILCAGKKYPPYTANTKGSAIRVNNADGMEQNGIEFKDLTIKAI